MHLKSGGLRDPPLHRSVGGDATYPVTHCPVHRPPPRIELSEQGCCAMLIMPLGGEHGAPLGCSHTRLLTPVSAPLVHVSRPGLATNPPVHRTVQTPPLSIELPSEQDGDAKPVTPVGAEQPASHAKEDGFNTPLSHEREATVGLRPLWHEVVQTEPLLRSLPWTHGGLLAPAILEGARQFVLAGSAHVKVDGIRLPDAQTRTSGEGSFGALHCGVHTVPCGMSLPSLQASDSAPLMEEPAGAVQLMWRHTTPADRTPKLHVTSSFLTKPAGQSGVQMPPCAMTLPCVHDGDLV